MQVVKTKYLPHLILNISFCVYLYTLYEQKMQNMEVLYWKHLRIIQIFIPAREKSQFSVFTMFSLLSKDKPFQNLLIIIAYLTLNSKKKCIQSALILPQDCQY
jgi:hypothetical protein